MNAQQTWIIVNTPRHWDFDIPGVRVLAARQYVTDKSCGEAGDVRIYNLARSYRYMSLGYYVSLLAEARGHRPMPSVHTIQDLRSPALVRATAGDIESLIARSLSSIRSDRFTLSIYFGRNLAKQHDRLSLALFNLFPAPLLRAQFVRVGSTWSLQSLSTISAREVPESHRDFVVSAAQEFFGRRNHRRRTRKNYRYDLAILHNSEELAPPSNSRALGRFARAAEKVGLRPTLVTRDDYGRLSEFDALFLRETTYVNHHTFRFASRAAASGLFVIDDPVSIIRCTNKVYLAELLERRRIPTPRTVIIHRENLAEVTAAVQYPCILKRPDSSFSQGVVKVENDSELRAEAETMLADSDLLILQEFVPTDFDWRVGVLAGEPLYVCRYHMAREHWQIIHWRGEAAEEGASDALRVEDAPRQVVRLAVRAARLIGSGFYGVDLKEVGRRRLVIEVNDNPSIDAGVEDGALGAELYERIMSHFVDRLDSLRKQRGAR